MVEEEFELGIHTSEVGKEEYEALKKLGNCMEETKCQGPTLMPLLWGT